MFRYVCIVLCTMIVTAPISAQICPPNASTDAASSVLSLQRSLMAASVPWMDPDIPTALRPTIHNFKQALIATVETTIRCDASESSDPAALQSHLASLLRANRPQKPFVYVPPTSAPPETDTGSYGDDLKIEVKLFLTQAGLISVQITYDIECGDDNILLLYRRTGSQWDRELLWQNPDPVSSAFGDFFLFAIVPSNSPLPYTLAIAHGTPWCTSTWSRFSVDLVSPASGQTAQKQLTHIEQNYRREDDVRMKATSNGLEIRASVTDLAMDNNLRQGVFRYRTTNGKLERIQPIANNTRDFVDEWLQIPWSEAAKWSVSPSPALKSAHNRFDDNIHLFEGKSGGTPTVDQYGPVRACTSAKGLYQIEIDLEQREAW